MPVLYEYNTISENISLAEKLSLDFIELNLNFSYVREALSSPEALKTLFKDTDMDFTLHFFDECDFASYNEVVNGYFTIMKNILASSEEIKIRNLNVHLNPGPVVTISGIKHYIYEKEFGPYIERLVTNLNRVRDLCNKYGITLVLENVENPPFMDKTYERLIREGFYFCWDIGHDHTHEDRLKKFYSSHPDMVFKEFHIHDATLNKDHLALGKGELDIAYYKHINPDACYLIEVKSSQDLITSIPKFDSVI